MFHTVIMTLACMERYLSDQMNIAFMTLNVFSTDMLKQFMLIQQNIKTYVLKQIIVDVNW